MADIADNELLDYEEEEQAETVPAPTNGAVKSDVKGTYVSIHSSGFRDFLLKPEILRAIVDCGFEHPSEGIVETLLVLLYGGALLSTELWLCRLLVYSNIVN